jgi:hypothetical protein
MTLLEHYKNGTIKELFDKGVISINVYTYFRYNEVFEAYLMRGYTRNKSYEYTADECGCSKLTIINAIKAINKQ